MLESKLASHLQPAERVEQTASAGKFSIPLRPRGKFVVWSQAGNSPEEDIGLGIRNIQGFFLERFPEFKGFLSINDDESLGIPSDKAQAAKRFILERIGSKGKFIEALGGSPTSPIVAPYFKSSYRSIIATSFASWGVSFQAEGTDNPLPPRNHKKTTWTAEKIEEETQQFILGGNRLTFRSLLDSGKSDLSGAAQKYYPGGLHALQEKFGVATGKDPKPHRYWQNEQSPEILRQEARKFFDTYGQLSHSALIREKRADLVGTLKHYPNHMKGLKRDLQLTLSDPKLTPRVIRTSVWTPERIKEEAMEFTQAFGSITYENLGQYKRGDLLGAIARRYPGGITQLRKDINIQGGQRPHGYWKNPANVEKEALEFYQQYGHFSQNLMVREGRTDLWIGIVRYYPGRIQALKKTLNITEDESVISPDEANEQLRKLLEENV